MSIARQKTVKNRKKGKGRKSRKSRSRRKTFFRRRNIMRGGSDSSVSGNSVFMPGGSGCPHRLMSKEEANQLLEGGYNGDNDC